MKTSLENSKIGKSEQEVLNALEGFVPNQTVAYMALFSKLLLEKALRLELRNEKPELEQGQKRVHVSATQDLGVLKEALTKIIDELPTQEKILFSLYYCEELNVKEIAKVLDCCEQNVVRALSDGMRRLAKQMNEKEAGLRIS